jgi:eukaryotic-like serine/threonine-protein kinase
MTPPQHERGEPPGQQPAGTAATDPDEELVERLAEAMRQRWERGERPLAEEFLGPHPQLGQRPELALDLLYEEVCLRQRFGLPAGVEVFTARFPRWREALAVLFDCQRLLEPLAPPESFPQAGERLGDFLLLAELGRGGTGPVFLARQSSLAGRPVVLKLTSRSEHEHLCLARLQHTHIVPLYAADVLPATRLRLLCMPYFGGATLAAVLQALAPLPVGRRTGRDLVEALGRTSGPDDDALPRQRPVCELLGRLSYVQAVCYVGACLGDALSHAHGRRLVHLDVKPANVLLAADGQPMLLDFHLAREPLAAGSVIADALGGTPAYMPPELRRAFEAARAGLPLPCGVDQRADVYSLSAVLYEALGGTVPLPPGRPPHLSRVNPGVSVGLGDLIERSLAADPARRHARAADLAEDLRRHLRDLPLRSVPNRSWKERWARWRRRNPRALRNASLAGAVLLSLLAAGLAFGVDYRRRVEEADRALQEGRQRRERGLHGEALATLQRGLDQLRHLPLSAERARKLREEMELVRAGQEEALRRGQLRRLHELADRLRSLHGQNLSRAQQRSLDERCGQIWRQRDDLVRRLRLGTDPATEDFLDVILLWLDRQPPGRDPDAVAVLDDLERLFGPSAAVRAEQSRRAGKAAAPADTPEPRSAWEHAALGRMRLQQGRVPEAEQHFERAWRMAPGDRWISFLLGQCAFRLGRYEEAVAAFSLCVGADPGNPVHYYNRALAHSALGRQERAVADLDQALRLDETFAPAWLQRGLLRLQAKQFSRARGDLRRALAAGSPPGVVHYHLGRLALAAGEPAEARRHLEQALRDAPGLEEARDLLPRLGGAGARAAPR